MSVSQEAKEICAVLRNDRFSFSQLHRRESSILWAKDKGSCNFTRSEPSIFHLGHKGGGRTDPVAIYILGLI